MPRTFYGLLSSSVRAAQREHQAAYRANVRAQERAARLAERDRKKQAVWDEKERKRLYLEGREEEARERTDELEARVDELKNLLADSLHEPASLDFHALKEVFEPVPFNPGELARAKNLPAESTFLPGKRTFLEQVIPSLRRKYSERVEQGAARFQLEVGAHSRQEAFRTKRLAEAQAVHAEQEKARSEEVTKQHEEVEQFESEVRRGDPRALKDYFRMFLETRAYPQSLTVGFKTAYSAESKQVAVECDLPSIEIVPEVAGFKFVKSKDEIVSLPRSLATRRAIYASLIAQITLRTLRELLESDQANRVSSAVVNAHVNAIDPGTGKPVRPCLVSVRTTSDAFKTIDLGRVEPLACLKGLNASVSKSPAELAAVRPVLDFKMVDPRFITGSDVLSDLDRRPNLMELSPNEFEALISNLFQKMGLETRQTRPSRDGGVDCVAYDPRPIFGGKVIIQAKEGVLTFV